MKTITAIQIAEINWYASKCNMPQPVLMVLLKLADRDYKNLDRWIISGAWLKDIIRILKECKIYDSEIEGMIESELQNAEASL